MPCDKKLLLDVLSSSVSIANGAGNIVRSILSSGQLNITEKTGKNDLQTKADRSASDAILLSFQKQFPDLNVVSEEGSQIFTKEVPDDWIVANPDEDVANNYKELISKIQDAKMEELTVWVDPLDGTKEFTEGFLDHVTILIGIAIGNEAVAGVIYQPYFNYKETDKKLGRTLYGIVGVGVFDGNGKKIEAVMPPKDAKIVTTTRSHSTGLVGETIDCLNATDVIKVGGAGHKVLLLIDGVAHAYVFPTPGLKKWDTCAPEAILHALGGKMTDIKGNENMYKKGVQFVNDWGCIATALASEHQGYVQAIPKELSDQVKDYFKNKKR